MAKIAEMHWNTRSWKLGATILAELHPQPTSLTRFSQNSIISQHGLTLVLNIPALSAVQWLMSTLVRCVFTGLRQQTDLAKTGSSLRLLSTFSQKLCVLQ